MMSYYHNFKTVNALCSFILLRRFSFQGRMKGLHHLTQPSRTIVALSSSGTRNEQQRSKGERQQKDNVLLLDETGSKHGEMSLPEAQRIAKERSLELIWVNKHNTTDLPIYRMMAKLEISLSKTQSLKPPKTKKIELSENIESHDLMVKVKHIQQYLEKGHQVKLSVKSKRRTNSDVSDDKLDVIKKVEQEMKGVKVERPIQESPQLVTCVFKPILGANVKLSSSKTS